MKNKRLEKAMKDLQEHYDNLPDWYWKKGLYDSEIKSVKEISRPDKRLHASDYILLEISLDSSGAEYDSDIKALYFYNYRVTSGNRDLLLKDAIGTWWFDDKPSETKDGKLKLELVLKDINNNELKYVIEFDRVEIIRNK